MRLMLTGLTALAMTSCGAAQNDSPSGTMDKPALPDLSQALEFVDARLQASNTTALITTDPNKLPDFALFKDCEICPEMIVIPGGSFGMGSPKNEVGHMHDEEPHIKVTLPRFALARFETRWDEWDVCSRAGKCTAENDDQGWGRGRRPVPTINIPAAQSYIAFLNENTSGKYRLPTETEWEYAARAGTKTTFSFGDTISTEQVNFNGNGVYGAGSKGVFREQTVDVGSFPANPFGLFDMHGNVWEWVQDCYTDTLSNTPKNGSANVLEGCRRTVLRGGSFDHYPRANRSSIRHSRNLEDIEVGFGFRVARTLKP